MTDQAVNALVAVALGLVVALLLFIPVAAVQYRLDGRLGPSDLFVLVTAAIYALALWTYTLLPVPEHGSFACQGRQTELLAFVGDIRRELEVVQGASGLLRDPVFLQVALNVVLFLPFGFFVRWILGRGFLVATVLGFATSLLIETTQTTGVWGVYDCAYRLFDVDDLVTNTTGAFLGSVVSAVVIRKRHQRRPLPTRITAGRRLVGMVCDGLFVVLVGGAAAVGYRAYQHYVAGREYAAIGTDGVQVLLQWGLPGLVEAACVLALGRTVGELVVSVRAVARRTSLVLPSRLVKLLTGVGGMILLASSDAAWTAAALAAFVVVTLACALLTREHRGLSHLLSGMELRVSSDPGSRSTS